MSKPVWSRLIKSNYHVKVKSFLQRLLKSELINVKHKSIGIKICLYTRVCVFVWMYLNLNDWEKNCRCWGLPFIILYNPGLTLFCTCSIMITIPIKRAINARISKWKWIFNDVFFSYSNQNAEFLLIKSLTELFFVGSVNSHRELEYNVIDLKRSVW